MAVSRDVDLTLKLDFSKDDHVEKSIRFPRDEVDSSYKRYNEYKDEFLSSSTNSLNSFQNDFFPINSTTSSTTSSFNMNLWNSFTRKVEERVCWRKLYKDSSVYEQSYTAEEWEDRIKNSNFPLGSKLDRLRTHYELLREAEHNFEGTCDCCGARINYNNCLTHYYELCQRCNYYFHNHIDSIRL